MISGLSAKVQGRGWGEGGTSQKRGRRGRNLT